LIQTLLKLTYSNMQELSLNLQPFQRLQIDRSIE